MDTAMLGLVSVSLAVCTEVRGVERRSTRRSPLKGRQTNIGTFSKATFVKLLRDGLEHILAFPSALISY